MAGDVVVRVEPDEDAPKVILIMVTMRSFDDDDDIVPGMAEIGRARRCGSARWTCRVVAVFRIRARRPV